MVTSCLTSGPGAGSDPHPWLHPIGGEGEEVLVGELRGGGAVGGQDVLDLRGEGGGGGGGVEDGWVGLGVRGDELQRLGGGEGPPQD